MRTVVESWSLMCYVWCVTVEDDMNRQTFQQSSIGVRTALAQAWMACVKAPKFRLPLQKISKKRRVTT